MDKLKTRILIVDDDPGMARTTALILQRKGYSTDVAGDGPAAIEKARRAPFDVVLMDIKMPQMNGVEAYKRLKAIRPGSAVIMMTAYAVEDLVSEALQEGARGIVYKPLDIERTIELIEKARQEQEGAVVLVIDDDPEVCCILQRILEHKGYFVAIAHDGEEAITKAQEHHHDIILIDVKLPPINGLETYRTIRKIDPEAVAVMMTAYRQETSDLVTASLRSSAYACLYKPFDLDELLALLAEINGEKTR